MNEFGEYDEDDVFREALETLGTYNALSYLQNACVTLFKAAQDYQRKQDDANAFDRLLKGMAVVEAYSKVVRADMREKYFDERWDEQMKQLEVWAGIKRYTRPAESEEVR